MNLSLKINDIKIEVSSELGVNSGLDIHLALQNDPTSAVNHEKIILEISRALTNPSTSKDHVEEFFSEVRKITQSCLLLFTIIYKLLNRGLHCVHCVKFLLACL